MAEIKDKLVDVKGLRHIYKKLDDGLDFIESECNDRFNNTLSAATNIPVPGQILVADGNFSWSWKDPQGSSSSVDEATVRRIVNEQLAKMKFTVNNQGHLIIETPEA